MTGNSEICSECKSNPKGDILVEAQEIISSQRDGLYPKWELQSRSVCSMMNTLYEDLNITPDQFTMIMICYKMTREAKEHKRDNLVDIAGYTGLLDQICED